MFILGFYAVNRSIFTRSFKILKTLREMAMPFYLIHLQVLVAVVSGTLWVPYLGSFIVTIIIATFLTCAFAFLITKLPGPVRYFFGLSSNHWLIPGRKLNGFIPVLVLSVIIIVEITVSNVIINYFPNLLWMYCINVLNNLNQHVNIRDGLNTHIITQQYNY